MSITYGPDGRQIVDKGAVAGDESWRKIPRNNLRRAERIAKHTGRKASTDRHEFRAALYEMTGWLKPLVRIATAGE